MALDPSIITRDLNQLAKDTKNIYESVVIISKRARQISAKVKEELSTKLAEFATTVDNLEEIFENREQIEISRIDKEGIAAGYGLKKGDLILTVDGIKIESLEQFRLLVSRKGWGEDIRLGLEKKIEFQKKPDRDPAAGK